MKMSISYVEPVPPSDDRYGQKHRLKVEIEMNFSEEIDKAIASLTVLKNTLPTEKGEG